MSIALTIVLSRWEWKDVWVVDASQSHGNCDPDGWYYGTSFESVLAKLLTMSASGQCTSTCLVRRRRWIRFRQATSEEAILSFSNNITQYKEAKLRHEHLLRIYESDYKIIDSYEIDYLSFFKVFFGFYLICNFP